VFSLLLFLVHLKHRGGKMAVVRVCKGTPLRHALRELGATRLVDVARGPTLMVCADDPVHFSNTLAALLSLGLGLKRPRVAQKAKPAEMPDGAGSCVCFWFGVLVFFFLFWFLFFF
jgi:hypothetical protein